MRLVPVARSARKSADTVAEFVEWYYALTSSTGTELLAYARDRKNNPYRAATRETINDVPHGDRIICGHHPWLYGRKVKNLTVDTQLEAGDERLAWVEPDSYRYRADGSGFELDQQGLPDSEVRVRQGALAALGARGSVGKKRASRIGAATQCGCQ